MPGNFQTQRRKTHCHAMVIVGFNFRTVQRRGVNRQRVVFLDDFGAAPGQFRVQGGDPVTFLHAEVAEVDEFHRMIREGRGDNHVMMLSPRSAFRETVSGKTR